MPILCPNTVRLSSLPTQFAFLYDGWDNKWSPAQLKIGLGFLAFGGLLLLAFAPSFAFVGASLETLFGLSASFGLGAGTSTWLAEQSATIQELGHSIASGLVAASASDVITSCFHLQATCFSFTHLA